MGSVLRSHLTTHRVESERLQQEHRFAHAALQKEYEQLCWVNNGHSHEPLPLPSAGDASQNSASLYSDWMLFQQERARSLAPPYTSFPYGPRSRPQRFYDDLETNPRHRDDAREEVQGRWGATRDKSNNHRNWVRYPPVRLGE